jgi:hypothetical protein
MSDIASTSAFTPDPAGQVAVPGGRRDFLSLRDGIPQCLCRLHLLGDVGRVLYDLERPAHFVHDRIVGSLNPYLLAALADTLVLSRVVLAAPQLFPEQAVLLAGTCGRLDEHAVVLALDFVQRVTQCLQEIFVGLEYLSFQRELDHRLRLVDGSELASGIVALQFRFGDVVAYPQVFARFAILAENRRHHCIDVIGRAVLGAILDDAAENLAATDG